MNPDFPKNIQCGQFPPLDLNPQNLNTLYHGTTFFELPLIFRSQRKKSGK